MEMKINNAEIGITIQKLICDKYNITPNQKAIAQFEASYNNSYQASAENVIEQIFNELSLTPVECLTFAPSNKPKERLNPHNFLLSNESTLSLRTNKSGDKIAPRVVGQAGIDTFNEHFSEIIGYEIREKRDIKKAIINNIELMLPIFIDYFFISDFTVWIQLLEDNTFRYSIFDKSQIVDINLEHDNFSFTKDIYSWNESTTLKYKGKSLAEIQIHKNRTFKFRFIMNTLAELLVEQKITNETLGISAEVGICELFSIPIPKEYHGRYSRVIIDDIAPILRRAFAVLPGAVSSTGAGQGTRGKNSKSSYDFILKEEKTLSVKTNTGSMVCPPEVGQPCAATCYLYFKNYVDGTEINPFSFKKMVYDHIAEIMPIYLSHLFDSDYLLWIYKENNTTSFKIFDYGFANQIVWKADEFSFSRPTINEWNESNTVKYKGIRIGEFQVHNNRSSYKFRIDLKNLEKLLSIRDNENE